jgi:hypothetical protein
MSNEGTAHTRDMHTWADKKATLFMFSTPETSANNTWDISKRNFNNCIYQPNRYTWDMTRIFSDYIRHLWCRDKKLHTSWPIQETCSMNTRLTPQTSKRTKPFSDYDEMTYRRGIWRLELHAYIQHYDDQTYCIQWKHTFQVLKVD